MALQDSCTLFNQLEDAALVSQIGPNGVVVGAPTFPAARFGYGIDPAIGNYAQFVNACPAGRSVAEFWWRPDNDSTVYSPAGLYYALDAGANDQIIFASNFPAGFTGNFYVFDNGVRRVQYRYNFAYTGGVLYHLLFDVDSAAGATNRVKLYLDGALQTPAQYTDDDAFNLDAPMDVFIGHPTVWTAQCAVDNIKVYGNTVVVVEAIANKDNEYWPLVARLAIANKFNRIEGVLAA